MQVFGISDVGKKRTLNEDNFSVEVIDSVVVALVCDGMGGANAGEVASRLACRLFITSITPRIKEIRESTFDKTELIIKMDRAIYEACDLSNKKVFEKSSSDDKFSGMGTTISGCVIADDILWTFNVGDSRVYNITGKDIEQLTVDHSFVQALLDEGKITPEEAKNHPNRNVIMRALGIKKSVDCDVSHMEMKGGYYLICSDGLSSYFEKERFLKIINSPKTVSEKVEDLVTFANLKGGSDNITVILIDTEK